MLEEIEDWTRMVEIKIEMLKVAKDTVKKHY